MIYFQKLQNTRGDFTGLSQILYRLCTVQATSDFQRLQMSNGSVLWDLFFEFQPMDYRDFHWRESLQTFKDYRLPKTSKDFVRLLTSEYFQRYPKTGFQPKFSKGFHRFPSVRRTFWKNGPSPFVLVWFLLRNSTDDHTRVVLELNFF